MKIDSEIRVGKSNQKPHIDIIENHKNCDDFLFIE